MPLLEMKHITKSFAGVYANEDVDLSVEQGEIHALLGENGAGKTTLMNILFGIYQADRGEICFKGEHVEFKSPGEAIARGIGMVHQHFSLVKKMTVLDNVKTALHNHVEYSLAESFFHLGAYHKKEKAMDEKAIEILKVFDLDGQADVLASNLPYGKQRKLEIARALAISPKILLLDEPAAGMNPNETHELLLFVKKLNAEGLTVVVIEHDLKFIMNVCDHIMVLNYGQKLCEGNAQEIQNNKQVQEAYFGKRAGLGGTEG